MVLVLLRFRFSVGFFIWITGFVDNTKLKYYEKPARHLSMKRKNFRLKTLKQRLKLLLLNLDNQSISKSTFVFRKLT